MTPEAQRITIAEACGWKRDEICDNWKRNGEVAYCDGRSLHYRQIPDYLNDLNAMREVEYELRRSQIPEWERHVRQITHRDGEDDSGLYERIIRATAAQRAEAFLRTIGKWTE